jgi:hypothetical protein
MTNKAKLLHQLNQLKRDDRALKAEELNIQRTTATRGHQESLALNHEQRMKNKRQQRRIIAELGALVPLAPRVVGQPVAHVANPVQLLLPQHTMTLDRP